MTDNVNERVLENNIHIFGFDKEIDNLLRGINRYKKHNVLLIGKAGVGKTALVERLAERINNGNVPKAFRDKVIYELSLNSLISGTKYRGDFEQKVEELLNDIIKDKDIILFVDEIHNIMRLGAAKDNGAMSLSETLKPYLARGQITLIGVTTLKEYNKHIRPDFAFDRRFNKIKVNEPSLKTTVDILKSYEKEYEDYYGIDLREKDFYAILLKSMFRRGNYPDKAIDTMEDYCYMLQEKTLNENE